MTEKTKEELHEMSRRAIDAFDHARMFGSVVASLVRINGTLTVQLSIARSDAIDTSLGRGVEAHPVILMMYDSIFENDAYQMCDHEGNVVNKSLHQLKRHVTTQ